MEKEFMKFKNKHKVVASLFGATKKGTIIL